MKQKAKREERREPVAPLVALTVVVPPWVHAELDMANPAVDRKRAVNKERQTLNWETQSLQEGTHPWRRRPK